MVNLHQFMICSFGNKPLISGRSVKMENEDYNTKLNLSENTRKNTGVYILRAKNTSGCNEATVKVIILDKPGPPVGPLEVTDMHKEGYCTLHWNKPKDEGRLPITSKLFEKMDTTTGKWIHAGFVDPTKTEHKINGPEPNKKYHFRVKALNEEG